MVKKNKPNFRLKELYCKLKRWPKERIEMVEKRKNKFKLYIKEQINVSTLLLSLGLFFIEMGIQIIIDPGNKRFLLCIKKLSQAILQLPANKLPWWDLGIGLTFISAGIFIFLFKALIIIRHAIYKLYYYWMILTALFMIVLLRVDNRIIIGVVLYNCLLFLIFTLLWIVRELYLWVMNQSGNMIPKLTLILSIIFTCLGYILGKK